MIRARQYLDYCYMCQIPLAKTELRILDELTDKNGWVDEEKYVDRMTETPIFVTQNQLTILAMLPKKYERTRRSRLNKMGHFLAEVYQLNKYGF